MVILNSIDIIVIVETILFKSHTVMGPALLTILFAQSEQKKKITISFLLPKSNFMS